MSEQDEATMSARIEFLNSNDSEMTLVQRYIGMSPAVLIEPELDENDQVTFNIIAVDVSNKTDLAELLEGLVDLLRVGQES